MSELTKVRVADGVTFVVYAPVDEFKASLQAALRARVLIEITNREGKTRYLNPIQVISLEDAE